MKKITIQDVAREVGVSIGTVDRAIHNRPGINPNTKEKIQAYIKEHNYTMSILGRQVKPAGSNEFKIGVIVQSLPLYYWDNIRKGVYAAEEDLSRYGIKIILQASDWIRESAELLKKIDELVLMGVNAIVLVPINNEIIKNKINELVENGISVVTLNDDIPDTRRLFYIGPHLRQDGRVAGELMGLFLKGKGKVFIISNNIESWEYSERIKGFTESLKEKYPEIEILANYTYNYSDLNSGSYLLLKSILEEVHELNGIYDMNGNTSHTGKLIKESEKLKNVVLIGHEVWSEVKELIQEGIVKACVCQDPFEQGYFAIKLLCKYAFEGIKPEYERMYSRIDIVMKENHGEENCIDNVKY